MAKKLMITPLDPDKVENGVWHSYLGVEFLCRRSDTEDVRARRVGLVREWAEEHPDHPKSAPVPARDWRRICALVWLERGIVRAWRKRGAAHVDLPEFSVEAFMELMDNDPDCFRSLDDFMSNRENFYRQREGDLGNGQNVSSISGSGSETRMEAPKAASSIAS